jgi:hypothetical protein
MKQYQKIYFIPILLLVFATSCKKFITVAPPIDGLATVSVFSDSLSASGAVVGIYSQMNAGNAVPEPNITACAGAGADEILLQSGSSFYPFYTNTILTDNTTVNSVWVNAYQYIYDANAIIEGVQSSNGISTSAKNRFIGEAKFIRAFWHFYLANLFGDVPLILSTKYQQTASLPRTPLAQVYQQIMADLKDAKNLLAPAYITTDKARPNKWTASALLARADLYTGNWAAADSEATNIIGSGTYLPLPAVSSAFIKTSTETIWQLYPVNAAYNTYDAQFFVPGTTTNIPNYQVSPQLLGAFEPGDQRLTSWIGSYSITGTPYYYPYKYKLPVGTTIATATEYTIMFRLAEQYLIRAEARGQENNLPGAIADMNVIRARAGLAALAPTLTQPQVLAAVAQERRIELFAEWGHRWLDLKRTNQATAVLSVLKPSTWQPTAVLWPIPIVQINANPFLTQNPGY